MKHWRDMDSSERHTALREHGGMGTGDLNRLYGLPPESRTIAHWATDNGVKRATKTNKLLEAPPIAPEDAKIFGGIWSMSDDARRQHNYKRFIEGARKTRAAQQ